MPDELCHGTDCQKKFDCKRYLAKPAEIFQEYGDFKQQPDGQCDGFWPLTKVGV